MTLIKFNETQDIITTKLDTANAQFTASTTAQANASGVWIFMANSTTAGYLSKPDITAVSATNISSSAAFRQIATFFFGTNTYVPDSYDGVTQRTSVHVIQVGRPTLDEGFYPNSITAVINKALNSVTGASETALEFSLTAYDSQNLSSLNSPLGLTGAMLNKSDTADVVGTVFYDHGVIVFHGGKTASQLTVSSNAFALMGGNGSTASLSSFAESGYALNLVYLKAQTRNVVKRTVYFTRGFNRDFNYSTNPTARTSDGYIIGSLTANPTTFVTTVGLYDDTGNLLAVGKVNPPKRKDQYSEVLFKVQLDF